MVTEKYPTLLIVIDTNFIYDLPSFDFQRFKSLVQKVNLIGGQVCIPQPVLEEAEQKYFERVKALATKSESLKKELESARVKGKIEIDDTTAMTEYRSRILDFIKASNILIIPFASNPPSHRELFGLATKKQPPFDAKGQSLRDALIWYSLKEYAESHLDEIIFFQTEDDEFYLRCISDQTSNLSVMKHEKILAGLDNYIKSEEIDKRENLKLKILKNINVNDLKNIKEFVEREYNFELKVNQGDELVSIDSLELNEVESLEDLSENDDGVIGFVAAIKGKLRGRVKTTAGKQEAFTAAVARMMNTPRKVGQSRSVEPFGDSLSAWSYMPVIEDYMKYILLFAECSIKLDGDNFTEFSVKRVEKWEDISDKEFMRERALKARAFHTQPD